MTELADIFRDHGTAYRENNKQQLSSPQREAMWAIEYCRTETFGGHVFQCGQCDEIQYSYHSCQNRHCPKCQNKAGQAWLEKQQALLLPVSYFVLTFTIPAKLKPVVYCYQKQLYNILFRTSAQAAQKLAHDPKFVGGQIGMVGVLQTWARDLTYHPHIHYLIPGGGLSAAGDQWLAARQDFLVPVKALSRIFRAKFRDALRQTEFYDQVPATVWQQKWVVHCLPVKDGVSALKYLAPYIFRVAISNNRILKLENDHVTFRYQDAKSGKTKYCTLPAESFIRRFLLHILPKGFIKVRYYGLFSSGNRKRLAQARKLLATVNPPATGSSRIQAKPTASPDTVRLCPQCGQEMKRMETLTPRYRHPP